LGCLDAACTLCVQNPQRRCNDSCFAPKYLAGDILKAKCGASIRAEIIMRTTGSPAPQQLIGDVLLEARPRALPCSITAEVCVVKLQWSGANCTKMARSAGEAHAE